MTDSKFKLFWRETYFLATKHNMSCMSAQLTYGVIIAIVPFFAVLFAFIHSRKNFDNFLDGIISPFLQKNFGFTIGKDIANYINNVVVNAQISELSIISFVSFLVTIILLLLLLESIFNTLLDTKLKKNYFVSLLKCWLLLTFSPFLFMLETFRSEFLINAFNFVDHFLINEDIRFLRLLVGFFSQTVFFALLYYVMPSRSVKFFAAFFGAFVTTFSLEVVRYINIYLVKNALVADTSQLYGSIPLIAILFFVWLRLVLYIILFGFVFSVAFERTVYKTQPKPLNL